MAERRDYLKTTTKSSKYKDNKKSQMGPFNFDLFKCRFWSKGPLTSKVIRSWSSKDFFRFEFSYGFGVGIWVFWVSKFLNSSSLSFSGLWKLAKNSLSFGVYKFERNFDQNLAKIYHFLAKFSIVQNQIWLSFNFWAFSCPGFGNL